MKEPIPSVASTADPAPLERRARGWPKRLALAMTGAMCAAVAASLCEAVWARRSAEGAETPSILAFAHFDLGVLAPLALALGGVVAVTDIALMPKRSRSPLEIARSLVPHDATGRTKFAAFLWILGPALALFATAAARYARDVMSSPAPLVSGGASMAVATLGLLLVALVLALAGAELLGTAAVVRAWRVEPTFALLGGITLAIGVVLCGVSLGTTSGEGGWLGIWGVLKRPELDLRGVGLLVLIALGAYVVPHAIGRAHALFAFALAAMPLFFTYEAAVKLGNLPRIASMLENAPLGKMSLQALRLVTDRDHDGFSAYFGGGDCNDRDAHVSPRATDIPGNGLDEDCSGSDAERPVARTVASAPATPEAHAAFPKDLNVLLITVDTLRADLGYAGNPKPLSPNIDALAAKSTVFERAYSLASYTGKSIGPLLIGKYPSETHRNWGHFNRYSAEDLLVSQRLQKRGIHTFGVHAHWYFAAPFGLTRGFDVWDSSAQPPPGPSDTDSTVTGAALTDAAIRVLQNSENTGRRFFGWVHYLDPHAEYVAHPGAPDLGTGMRAAYDGEVWYSDQQIGRLLEFIGRMPWASKTAIVLTSDHGEAFGEHHMIRHGFELWEELVRVPFLIYVPGIPAHHVTERRSAIDLVPTLLDLFQVPVSETGPFDFLSGRSLGDDLMRPSGYVPQVRDVFVDMPAGPNNDERRAFLHEAKKLTISNAVRFQLFDLDRDPAEKVDLSDNRDLMAEQRRDYQAFKGTLREVLVRAVPK